MNETASATDSSPQSTHNAILAIALLAAFADGRKHDAEREQIRGIAESLAGEGLARDLPRLYQDVLLKRVTLASASAALGDDLGARQLAYEMAVCVCDADGSQTPQEHAFIQQLHHALRLDVPEAAGAAAQAADAERQADTLAALPLPAAEPAATPAAAAPANALQVPESELQSRILRGAILAGALELLPQSWATMAIIPLQIRLVYRVGLAHGHTLDQGHIKEFIAAAGVGLTSQYIEQFGRKLLGGLLGKVGGSIGRGVGSAATGAAFSFATTYALGHLAWHHYGGGRQMNTDTLRQTFERLKGQAQDLQGRYAPQIQQQARTLDVSSAARLARDI